MIRTKYRNIPQTMGTQHPDNASAPYWESDSDGFVSTQEEVREAASAFQDLGCEEFMWDWEGKHVDEGVIEKLLTEYYAFFKKNQIGKDRFLTFRIPNIWQEKGRSLARAFMNILTSEEFARDLSLHTPPLFEVILPMAEDPKKIIQLHRMFRDLAQAKHRIFGEGGMLKHIEIIPLIESVDGMINIAKFLDQYVALYKKAFGKTPHYLRVFLARSDPAMMSGMIPAMLGNTIALSELELWSKRNGIPVFPWIGAGSLPFRGFLRPDAIPTFCATVPGARSVAIQSAFRYDFPLPQVQKAIKTLHKNLTGTKARILTEEEKNSAVRIIRIAEKSYQKIVLKHVDLINRVAKYIPRRRERRLHIGLLAYSRNLSGKSLPRAISFTGSWYSLGFPPEFIGLGECMDTLEGADIASLDALLPTLQEHLSFAAEYVNSENVTELSNMYPGLKKSLARDCAVAQEMIGRAVGPRTEAGMLHRAWTSTAVVQLRSKGSLTEAIERSSMYRKSIG